jgi:hypothetical protein
MWKETFFAHINLPFRNFPRPTEEKNNKKKRIVGVLAEIQTGHPLNTSQKRYRLSQLAL